MIKSTAQELHRYKTSETSNFELQLLINKKNENDTQKNLILLLYQTKLF